MDKNQLIFEIERLKKERNAIILAHNYQIGDVQDIADVVGDSYALAKKAASTDSDVIVFCGVHFMAESAKILNPEKTVLLPVLDAGCPMADMVDKDGLRRLKEQHPDAKVVTYINSSAEVKAESDVICTSSNALKVISQLDAKKIIFAPDRNLGTYIARKLPEKEFILWDGFCLTHMRVKSEEVRKVRELYPEAKLLVHPECSPEVQDLADFLGSTSEIIDYAGKIPEKEIIVGTEEGVLHIMRAKYPEKKFYLLSPGLICPNMKKTRLEDVYEALLHNRNIIEVDQEIRMKSLKALEEMLRLG
mgnify:CR=1 FL=1